MSDLTADEARRLLNYDPETGELRWRTARPGPARAGSVAGWIWSDRNGLKYRHVRILGREYCAHRICWLIAHGRWPADQIDHIDGNSLNNSIANLREANHAENSRNRGLQSNNTSGFKGVSWSKRAKKWVATITAGGRQKHLGSFDDPVAAYDAYCRAREQLHGEFARAV